MLQRRPSPAEPVYELRRIPIRECDEPLVDFREVCPKAVFSEPVFQYTRSTLMRKAVAEMLDIASRELPKGTFLGLVEGWRPAYIQRRMWLTSWMRFKKLHPEWTDLQLKRVCNRYVAPVDAKVPPPHSTGGAVDVMLVDADGKRLDHHTPYRLADPKSYATDVPGLSDTARQNRLLLQEVLLSAGLTNYPSEWWHWSFGDQGWAYRGAQTAADSFDRSFARYGRILEAAAWTPVPEDSRDEPLLRLAGNEPGSGFWQPSDAASSD